jgi:hypothetical protein
VIEVFLPSQLESYTDGVRQVSIDCDNQDQPTLMDVIEKLEQRYRGMAFRIVDEQGRIRRHIAIFIGENMVRELNVPIDKDARVQIVGALSGG